MRLEAKVNSSKFEISPSNFVNRDHGNVSVAGEAPLNMRHRSRKRRASPKTRTGVKSGSLSYPSVARWRSGNAADSSSRLAGERSPPQKLNDRGQFPARASQRSMMPSTNPNATAVGMSSNRTSSFAQRMGIMNEMSLHARQKPARITGADPCQDGPHNSVELALYVRPSFLEFLQHALLFDDLSVELCETSPERNPLLRNF
ncbi:hypothetical protein K438DRAFT_1750090 [Mycena galopus ATCC 62051]|nr:hypothetical protein K438DRAFT_1750090 [Mycena galopus ATCC 62051]